MSVKKAQGLPKPPYTQVPNIILDSMADLTNAELRVALAAVREIMGYHKENAGPQPMSLSWFSKKTGMTVKGVREGLRDVVKRGWLKESAEKGKRGVILYELNFQEEEKADYEPQVTSQSDYEPQVHSDDATMNPEYIVPYTSGTPYKETTTKEIKEGETAPEPPKADEVQPELDLPQLGAKPAHLLNFEASNAMSNPYIAAFTEIYGDPLLITDRRARIVADGLEQAGATPDDVRRIAKAKAAEGRKDYRFNYVLQDFAGEIAVATAQASPPVPIIDPDDVIRMDAKTYVPSNYRKPKAVDDVA